MVSAVYRGYQLDTNAQGTVIGMSPAQITIDGGEHDTLTLTYLHDNEESVAVKMSPSKISYVGKAVDADMTPGPAEAFNVIWDDGRGEKVSTLLAATFEKSGSVSDGIFVIDGAPLPPFTGAAQLDDFFKISDLARVTEGTSFTVDLSDADALAPTFDALFADSDEEIGFEFQLSDDGGLTDLAAQAAALEIEIHANGQAMPGAQNGQHGEVDIWDNALPPLFDDADQPDAF